MPLRDMRAFRRASVCRLVSEARSTFDAMASVRLMIPVSRSALPRWEVSADGNVIGWVQESKIGRTTRRFFHAYGVHPVTGKTVNLENHPDPDEAARVLTDFREHPENYSQHIW